jgi:hypothetical protein
MPRMNVMVILVPRTTSKELCAVDVDKRILAMELNPTRRMSSSRRCCWYSFAWSFHSSYGYGDVGWSAEDEKRRRGVEALVKEDQGTTKCSRRVILRETIGLSFAKVKALLRYALRVSVEKHRYNSYDLHPHKLL